MAKGLKPKIESTFYVDEYNKGNLTIHNITEEELEDIIGYVEGYNTLNIKINKLKKIIRKI